MNIVIDSSALTLLINPDARPPDDPATNLPLRRAAERVRKFIARVDDQRDVLIVPTPVVAEILVKAESDLSEMMESLRRLARVRIEPFGERAAVELAAMTVEALATGDKRGGHEQPWQRVKFDRQIVAIARVANSGLIYSDDLQLLKFARSLGMETVSTWELPVPDDEANLFTVAGMEDLDGATDPALS